MSFQATNPLTDDFELALDGPWTAYWLGCLRLVTGWWFFHAGVTKLLEDGLAYTYGPASLKQMTGTALGSVPVWMGNNLAWLIPPGVPLFETLIGLALMIGVFTRLAAAGGVFFTSLFWVGNAEFGHGLVNADLMGLLLFSTVSWSARAATTGLTPSSSNWSSSSNDRGSDTYWANQVRQQ